MKKLRWLALLPALAGVVFGALFMGRARLPYNELGYYFDSESGVVSSDYTDVLLVLAIVSFVVAVLFWLAVSRLQRD